jgi:ribosomal protein S18 acetylase RimI-like enzyme
MTDHPSLRVAGAADAEDVAALHADSWRRHYRGAYSDSYLDGDVVADRRLVWSGRLRQASGAHRTIVAEHEGRVVGFVHVIFDADPGWGALVENLHVTYARKRLGVGTVLLAAAAQAVVERDPRSGLHLYVLAHNTPAQAFYESRGGSRAGERSVYPPGDVPSRITGTPVAYRYVWPEPSALLVRSDDGGARSTAR